MAPAAGECIEANSPRGYYEVYGEGEQPLLTMADRHLSVLVLAPSGCKKRHLEVRKTKGPKNVEVSSSKTTVIQELLADQ